MRLALCSSLSGQAVHSPLLAIVMTEPPCACDALSLSAAVSIISCDYSPQLIDRRGGDDDTSLDVDGAVSMGEISFHAFISFTLDWGLAPPYSCSIKVPPLQYCALTGKDECLPLGTGSEPFFLDFLAGGHIVQIVFQHDKYFLSIGWGLAPPFSFITLSRGCRGTDSEQHTCHW